MSHRRPPSYIRDTMPGSFGLRSHDRHFIGCRADVAILPIGEGERDLGLPIACFARDPHGAVEVTASAPLVEYSRDFDRLSLGVFVWKFNRDNGMEVGRDTLTMVQEGSRARSLCKPWRSNPGVDLAALVAARQRLLGGIAEAHC